MNTNTGDNGENGPYVFRGEGNPGVVAGPTPPATRGADRRHHSRFRLPAAYTPVAVKLPNARSFALAGHAYDISEGGIQFELDQAIAPGTAVGMQIELPRGQGSAAEHDASGNAVFVVGNVVWVDDSEPGPVRMALAITRYARAGDQERLRGSLTSGRYSRAA